MTDDERKKLYGHVAHLYAALDDLVRECSSPFLFSSEDSEPRRKLGHAVRRGRDVVRSFAGFLHKAVDEDCGRERVKKWLEEEGKRGG